MKLREEGIAQLPSEAQECVKNYLRRLDDFRPWDCERCCQLAWEEKFSMDSAWIVYGESGESLMVLGENQLGQNAAFLRSPRVAGMVRVSMAGVISAANERDRHLTKERHVFALLPPAQEGVKQG